MSFLVRVVLLCFLVTPASALADAPVVTAGDEPPPDALSPAVRAVLAPTGATVKLDAARLDFWWIKELPVEGAEAAWSSVAEGALVGALRVDGEWKDIRGYTIRPGVYTLRFALQPQNGDHLGISPYREFLLLAPADRDLATDPAGHEGAVELSTHASRRSHPAAMSIDPPSTDAAPLSLTSNEFGHDVAVFQVPVAGGKGALTFGLVVRGTIEH